MAKKNKISNRVNILAIETSCDDTCTAIIRASGKSKPGFDVLSNVVSSQVEVHRKWGGVYPTLAKREHQKNLPLVLEKALKKAKNPKINLIAVTSGPGLEPCLWTGINFAQELAKEWNLQIIPVNHIEAHILANWLTARPPLWRGFPAICLVVSGGHTQLILMRSFGEYKILGETRDDAAGECFDKIAKILGLEYPGGPVIAAEAKKSRGQTSIKLPRPMINQKNYDFSFSGLKTAVLYNFKSQPKKIRKSKKYVREISKEAQQAIIDVLISKTMKAVKTYRAKTLILGGGVISNKELRKQLQKKISKELPNIKYLMPKAKFCTDNAVMTGIAGYFNWLKGKGKSWKKVKADANLKIC